ncbi:hypothetical protein HaLaN_17103 [Haematococcus lacustris]|uniref:Uncharacterized protein n=1 Tax=Haematococcus lacustris TaxID=44745 RepID=A0A699ZBI7_HAELA|nr:hypothetical protein HaLaN_17103 [Haematococcus lacustris]
MVELPASSFTAGLPALPPRCCKDEEISSTASGSLTCDVAHSQTVVVGNGQRSLLQAASALPGLLAVAVLLLLAGT